MAPPPPTEGQQRILDDYSANIYSVFEPLYEDKWDEALWQKAIGEHHMYASQHRIQCLYTTVSFESRYPPGEATACITEFFRQPTWDARKAQFIAGPPAWARDGWVSPLVGQTVDLQFMDEVRWVKGGAQGWREAKLLVLEFWATWCGVSLMYSRGFEC